MNPQGKKDLVESVVEFSQQIFCGAEIRGFPWKNKICNRCRHTLHFQKHGLGVFKASRVPSVETRKEEKTVSVLKTNISQPLCSALYS